MRRALVGVSGVVILVGAYLMGVRVNLSASLPRGLYRLATIQQPLRHGHLVVTPVPASIQAFWPWWVPLLKPIAGVAGEEVCVQGGHLLVQGQDYGLVYHHAHGKRLPALDRGCTTIPEGMVFLATPTPQSLDGRYFGLTLVTDLTAQAQPLLTWGP